MKSAGQAEEHFQNAFSGFLVLEEESHDDKLQYRLGQMLYQGIGTERNEEEAVRYWQQAAKLGNVNAQYALGKFWMDTGTGDADRLTLEQEIMRRQMDDEMEAFEEPPAPPEPPVSGGMGQGQVTEHTVPIQHRRPGSRPPLRTD